MKFVENFSVPEKYNVIYVYKIISIILRIHYILYRKTGTTSTLSNGHTRYHKKKCCISHSHIIIWIQTIHSSHADRAVATTARDAISLGSGMFTRVHATASDPKTLSCSRCGCSAGRLSWSRACLHRNVFINPWKSSPAHPWALFSLTSDRVKSRAAWSCSNVQRRSL